MDRIEDFLDEHLAEHQSAFNRWCVVLGDTLEILGLAAMITGHRRRGAAILATGYALVIGGHIPERNVGRAFQMASAHPIWTVRGDLLVAKELLKPPS